MKIRAQLRQTIKQLCPPIVLSMFRKVFAFLAANKRPELVEGEKSADWYDARYAESEEYKKPFYQSVYYPLWSVIADRISARGFRSINDIGCGAGQFAELLRFHGVENYRGLDLSEEAISLARKKELAYRFEVRDVIADPPSDWGQFDCTVSLEFLEHVQEDLAVIFAMPEGHRFIGTVPNFPFISHVRHFKDSDEVIARYGPYFKQLSVSTHMGDKEDKLFFLMDGVRAAS